MTKKDYELAADHIYNAIRYERLSNAEAEIAIDALSTVFKRDNNLFKPEKFKEACLTGKHIRKSIKGEE